MILGCLSAKRLADAVVASARRERREAPAAAVDDDAIMVGWTGGRTIASDRQKVRPPTDAPIANEPTHAGAAADESDESADVVSSAAGAGRRCTLTPTTRQPQRCPIDPTNEQAQPSIHGDTSKESVIKAATTRRKEVAPSLSLLLDVPTQQKPAQKSLAGVLQ